MSFNVTCINDSGKIYQYIDGNPVSRTTGVTDDITGLAGISGGPYDPTTYFATGKGSWLLKSVDNGVTWEKLDLFSI
jgi:hypothetical protein